MSHPDYKHIGKIEDKLTEELAELIQAVMKARRFGYFATNPLVKSDIRNIDKIRAEMEDVRGRIEEYDKFLSDLDQAEDIDDFDILLEE